MGFWMPIFNIQCFQLPRIERPCHWPTTEEFAARYQTWVESSKAEHVLLIKCLWVLCVHGFPDVEIHMSSEPPI